MTLNGYFTLYSVFSPVHLESETATFANNCVKTNKDRLILTALQIFTRDSNFWRYNVYAIFAGVLQKGGVKQQWGRASTHMLLSHYLGTAEVYSLYV